MLFRILLLVVGAHALVHLNETIEKCTVCVPGEGCWSGMIGNYRRIPPNCVPDLEISQRLCQTHFLEVVLKSFPSLWQTMDVDWQLKAPEIYCAKDGLAVQNTQALYRMYVMESMGKWERNYQAWQERVWRYDNVMGKIN